MVARSVDDKGTIFTVIFSIGLFAKTGYLQKSIKSPNNVICIYKYNGSLFAKNIGKKRYCKRAIKIDSLIKNNQTIRSDL